MAKNMTKPSRKFFGIAVVAKTSESNNYASIHLVRYAQINVIIYLIIVLKVKFKFSFPPLLFNLIHATDVNRFKTVKPK